jgi:hypothetical protein
MGLFIIVVVVIVLFIIVVVIINRYHSPIISMRRETPYGLDKMASWRHPLGVS